MAANTTFPISKDSQAGIVQFHKSCFNMQVSQWNFREQMRRIDLEYIRETNWTAEHKRAQVANAYGDASKLQDVTIPVVLPVVENAVAYQTSVFLTGNPIFGVVADVTNIDAAKQLETVIEENSTTAGWVRQLMMFFRDGMKYNLSAIEVDWKTKITAKLETDTAFSTKVGKPKNIVWQGNVLRRIDPYNMFFDARYYPTDIPEKGEFFGYTELLSRVGLKKFIAELSDVIKENIVPAFESGMGSTSTTTGAIESYFIPRVNPNMLVDVNPRRSFDWVAWAQAAKVDMGSAKIEYKNFYEVTTLYGRILPSDFKMRVPEANTPQVWKFIIVNHQVVIYAERQTNAHNLIPVLIGQPYEDGLGYQTKSLADNVKPFQQVASTLMNANIASRRRAISDRVLYDPSRISEHQMNNPNPSAKIPVRPNAYGTNIGEAVYQFPYRDDQAQINMQEVQQIMNFANVVSGQNPARQGQFVKGNKTLHEYDSVMANSNARDQMTSLLYESQIMTPMKNIIKLNILQFQGATSLYSRSRKEIVNIDPTQLRQAALEFKVSDGLIPSDKLINADTFQVAMQMIGSNPAIAAEYNLGPMFSYLMKTQNGHISDFEKSAEQKAYEQAVAAWSATTKEIAQLALKQGVDPKSIQLPPQPTPQQFNYTPADTQSVSQAQGE